MKTVVFIMNLLMSNLRIFPLYQQRKEEESLVLQSSFS